MLRQDLQTRRSHKGKREGSRKEGCTRGERLDEKKKEDEDVARAQRERERDRRGTREETARDTEDARRLEPVAHCVARASSEPVALPFVVYGRTLPCFASREEKRTTTPVMASELRDGVKREFSLAAQEDPQVPLAKKRLCGIFCDNCKEKEAQVLELKTNQAFCNACHRKLKKESSYSYLKRAKSAADAV